MAKCVFCGTTQKKTEERDNGVLLCDLCEEERQEKLQMTKEAESEMEKTIRPAQFEEVQEAEIEEEVPTPEEPKCEITVGVKKDGSLYFNAAGEDPNLLSIEALLDWGKRRVEKIWEEKDRMKQEEK